MFSNVKAVLQGNPILGVHIYLYSDDVTKVDCPKGSKNSPGDPGLGEALCHNVTDANGIFSLKSIPCGKTFIFVGVILLIWLCNYNCLSVSCFLALYKYLEVLSAWVCILEDHIKNKTCEIK